MVSSPSAFPNPSAESSNQGQHGNRTITYDGLDRLENKNGTLYAFDYGNRLRQAGPESYRYDAYGRRTRSSSSAGLLYTLYDQHGQLRWIRDERRGERRQYIYLQGSLLAEHTRAIGGSTHTLTYQHTDALGTPVAKTNASRTVVERSEYEPYGKLLNHPLEDGPGYTGHVSDAATGLSYMQQRYYDPGIGRFLSVDPVTANSPGGAFNRYWYANNNPYRYYDPDGRKPAGGDKPPPCETAECNQERERERDRKRNAPFTGQSPSSGIPSASENHNFQPTSIDTTEWERTTEIQQGSKVQVDSSGGIVVQPTSTSGPLPTYQFGFTVSQNPLTLSGDPAGVHAPDSWFKPDWYSSGFVGGAPGRGADALPLTRPASVE